MTAVVPVVAALALALAVVAAGRREGYAAKPPAGAIVATKLSDFKIVDDSLVYPRGAGPEVTNITQTAPGTFKFLLRHRGSWYDGDRDLQWNDKGKDKSRAEVAKLKDMPDMKVGETWDIGTTVWLSRSFVPSAGYCHIMQPVLHQSHVTLAALDGDDVTANLKVYSNGVGTPSKLVRSFTIKRGVWTSIVVRVKIATNGSYACSVNGDAFAGAASSLDTTKGADLGFRPKWGLYGTSRGVGGRELGDSVVYHKNIYARKVSGG